MALLGNIIWFILGGWWNFLLYGCLGLLCCITIIGIPIGKALFQYAKLMVFPFGKVIIRETCIKGKENVSAVRRVGGVIANIIWLPFGIISFIANIILMLGAAVTIIGIPVAVVIARSSKFLLWPIGAKVISKEQARTLRMEQAMTKMTDANMPMNNSEMPQEAVSEEDPSEASSAQPNQTPNDNINIAISLSTTLLIVLILLTVSYTMLRRKANVGDEGPKITSLDKESISIPSVERYVISSSSAPESTPILPYDQNYISGQWKTARREGNEIWTEYYTLYSDGTFYRGATGYMNTAYDPLDGENGWYVMPMGFPYSGGTYIFDGQELVLHYYADEYYGQAEETVTVSVRNLNLDNGSVEFDGIVYLLASSEEPSYEEYLPELEDLCDRLGVDYSAD